jgi:coproporphyrinogen III oxidase
MRILSFVQTAKEKVIADLTGIAGPGSCIRKTVPIRVGEADVAVIQGGPIEKAALTHLTMSRVLPPEATEPVDYMVFQLEIFPRNPWCPMGHFNTEWSLSGPGPYHMNLDVFPALRIQEDCARITRAMDLVAEKYGIDKAALREGLDEHYTMEHFDRPLSEKAGCKLMHLKDTQLDLFTEAYHTFFEQYLALLRKRRDTPFTAADHQQKLKRNGKWLEYLTLKDAAVRMGLATGIPPAVIIQLSFPPSAVF